jgi:hypothetical protein
MCIRACACFRWRDVNSRSCHVHVYCVVTTGKAPIYDNRCKVCHNSILDFALIPAAGIMTLASKLVEVLIRIFTMVSDNNYAFNLYSECMLCAPLCCPRYPIYKGFGGVYWPIGNQMLMPPPGTVLWSMATLLNLRQYFFTVTRLLSVKARQTSYIV